MNRCLKISLAVIAAQMLIVAPGFSQTTGQANQAELPVGVTRVALPTGETYLELKGNVSNFNVLTMAVKPETKYRLTMRARVEGPFTIEQNGRAHLQAIQRGGRWESTYEVLFHGPGLAESASGGGGFFLTREWYNYSHVFWTPAGVEKITVQLNPRKTDMQVANVSLVADDEGGVINANPDFRYGELNYCGWWPQRDGRILQRPDGKYVFRSGYGGSTPSIPMKAGRFYKITARGEAGNLAITYFDANGKDIANRFLLRFSEDGMSEEMVELSPPEGCVAAKVIAYNSLIEYFRVFEEKRD